MSAQHPPPYPDYSAYPSGLGNPAPAAPARPYAPWRNAVLAYVGGLGLHLVLGFVLSLVAAVGGLAAGLADVGAGSGQVAALAILATLVVTVVVALLQGSFLAGRGAYRPYVAALTAAAAAVVLALATRPVAEGLPVLAGAVAEIVVIALLTTHRPPAAA